MPRDSLDTNEPHPSAYSAKEYIVSLGARRISLYLESFSSCAIEGDRMAEICAATLNRLMRGQPVSDRYVLGLAWQIKQMEDGDD